MFPRLSGWHKQNGFHRNSSQCTAHSAYRSSPGVCPGLGRRTQEPQGHGAEAAGDGVGQRVWMGTFKVLLGGRAKCVSLKSWLLSLFLPLGFVDITVITEV